ncbi:MAG: YdiY family protein [Opitutales bacterium]
MFKASTFSVTLLLAVVACCHADVIHTRDGARLTGDIIRIKDGKVHLKTSYSGTLEVSQEEINSLETESPMAVRLESGDTLTGPINPEEDGSLRVKSGDGELQTEVEKIAASWPPSEEDPEIKKMRRNWVYEAAFDLQGREGNTEEFSLGVRFDAALEGPNDELAFSARYAQREKNGEKTADNARGKMSYESFYSEVFGWYVRSEILTDAINNIDLRATNGVGSSYRLINRDKHSLVARTGLAHEYTDYSGERDSESDAVLDLGLAHEYEFKERFSIETTLTYTPAIGDFSSYHIHHDTGFEMPIGYGDNWKLRVGVENQYESEPAAEEELDTIYYSRLVFSWE